MTSVVIEDDIHNNEVIDDFYVKGFLQRALFRNRGWSRRDFTSGMSNHRVFSSNNVKVSYNAGYTLPAETPGTITRAILWMISQDLATQGTSKGLAAFSISDVSWTFLKETKPEVYRWLSKYRSQLL